MTRPLTVDRLERVRSGARELVLDIAHATNRQQCGGKATGLAALMRARVAVPPAICLTTEFYRQAVIDADAMAFLADAATSREADDPSLRAPVLTAMRARVERMTVSAALTTALREGLAGLAVLPLTAVVVRSSAPYEDGARASHAGIHASVVVAADDVDGILAAVKTCWASLWSEAAWAYREQRGIPHVDASMGVIVQRFVDAGRSGVAFSCDPLTGDRGTLVVEAGWGMGAALVSGQITPDTYRVTMRDGAPSRITHRSGCHDAATLWRHGQHVIRPVASTWRNKRVLTDHEVIEIARLVKLAEGAVHMPADVEWAHDGHTCWLVQARPITRFGETDSLPGSSSTIWTRANLKEILPDLPSPLTVSYLSQAMSLMFRSYYTGAGYDLPGDARLVGVFLGRPYLNLSLMQHVTRDAGGDPEIVARLLGGTDLAESMAGVEHTGDAEPHRMRTARELIATVFRTPRRARRLFDSMIRQRRELRNVQLDRLDDDALVAHLLQFRASFLNEQTMGRIHEIVSAQSRAYMALEALLALWLPGQGESLVTRLITGLGTLPNVRMTHAVMNLAALAVKDERVRSALAGDGDGEALRQWHRTLHGTEFGNALQAFLQTFGHRAPYESDVMSPRFEEDPTPLFRLIKLYMRPDACVEPLRHAAERRLVREAATRAVRRELRHAHGPIGFATRWLAFSILCRALQQLLALRDECRHVTTMMVAHLRQIALEIGRRATCAGRFANESDVFLVSWDQLPLVLSDPVIDWPHVVQVRREQHERHAGIEVPDLLVGDRAPASRTTSRDTELGDQMVGFGVSPGTVTGSVRIFRSGGDLRVDPGDIVVLSAMEPTLTPIFPLVRGMIAEMGGLLSHAAILAREYGVPTVVSVPDATQRLHDGDRVEMDGTTGRIRVLRRAA